MDGRGRLAQSLTWIAHLRARPQSSAAAGPRAQIETEVLPSLQTSMSRWSLDAIWKLHLPPGVGLATALLVMGGGLAYGVIRGDHVQAAVELLDEIRNKAANAAGFRIVSVAVSG